MSESSEKKNESKTKPETPVKPMFTPGGKGGPGRGKVKARPPVSLQEMVSLVQGDLRSRDPKIRHAATKLLIILRSKMEEQKKEGSVLTPEAWAFYNAKVEDLVVEDEEYVEVDDDDL